MAKTWILLRGLIRESRHWEAFPALFSQQFAGDTVVTIDLPGNGEHYDDASPRTIEKMVACLRDELSKKGLRPPFHVAALSLGAMTAISWMSDYPGEVAAAVLMNTSVARYSPFWKRLRPQNYGSILFDGLLQGDALTKERMILQLTTNLISDAEREQTAQRWATYAATHPVSKGNALRQIIAAACFRAPAQAPQGAAILLLNGGGDRLVDPSCSTALARAWQVPLRVHPTAGHDLTMDAGAWVAAEIKDWLV
jgi:pimeloyl-ACP methyl ester carboxylesterase